MQQHRVAGCRKAVQLYLHNKSSNRHIRDDDSRVLSEGLTQPATRSKSRTHSSTADLRTAPGLPHTPVKTRCACPPRPLTNSPTEVALPLLVLANIQAIRRCLVRMIYLLPSPSFQHKVKAQGRSVTTVRRRRYATYKGGVPTDSSSGAEKTTGEGKSEKTAEHVRDDYLISYHITSYHITSYIEPYPTKTFDRHHTSPSA